MKQIQTCDLSCTVFPHILPHCLQIREWGFVDKSLFLWQDVILQSLIIDTILVRFVIDWVWVQRGLRLCQQAPAAKTTQSNHQTAASDRWLSLIQADICWGGTQTDGDSGFLRLHNISNLSRQQPQELGRTSLQAPSEESLSSEGIRRSYWNLNCGLEFAAQKGANVITACFWWRTIKQGWIKHIIHHQHICPFCRGIFSQNFEKTLKFCS